MKQNWSDYEMYLKPIHLKGQAVTLTIVKTTEEETHPQRGKSVTSPVLWFREMPFGFILSPTNRQTLIALYGDRVADCIGKPIVVKAVKEKVAGRDKEPIRIQNVRPTAPHVEPATGEIVSPPEEHEEPAVTYPEQPERVIVTGSARAAGQPEESSELEQFFGTSSPVPAPESPIKTEADFITWQKDHGFNGKETYQALGSDAKTWLKKHPEFTWADVARQVTAHQSAAK
jgi:hypothetical protein